MLIENDEECTDNVISYQFHVQNHLNRLVTAAVTKTITAPG